MELITEDQAIEQYNLLLDEQGAIYVGGLRYYPSYILQNVDPIAYDVGFNDYTDSLATDGILVEGETDDGYIVCDECDELTNDYTNSICKDCDNQKETE